MTRDYFFIVCVFWKRWRLISRVLQRYEASVKIMFCFVFMQFCFVFMQIIFAFMHLIFEIRTNELECVVKYFDIKREWTISFPLYYFHCTRTCNMIVWVKYVDEANYNLSLTMNYVCIDKFIWKARRIRIKSTKKVIYSIELFIN